jgi:hypothetical protein
MARDRGGLGLKGLCDHPNKKIQMVPKISPKDPFFDILYGRLSRLLRPMSHCFYGQSALGERAMRSYKKIPVSVEEAK